MSDDTGKCPGCDREGLTGLSCDEKACAKRGYRFIPITYWKRAHAEGRPDPLIGELIGDFLVVDIVGSGGFGRVFLALQSPLFRLRGALKVLEFPTDNVMLAQALLEKFQGEAEALADLSHPNIVRLMKYGMHNNRPYLVMELVDDAETLRQEIYDRAVRHKGFTHAQVKTILQQLLHGLQAAHARNIIHRDIKPENVMLQRVAGNPLHVRILDFGTAKFVENRADTKWPLGSPSYMAPEQVRLKNIGPWSDLYAVGVMCFELLTGKRPFPGATENEIVARKLDEGFDPFVSITNFNFPIELVDFLKKSIAREIPDRFQDAGEFLEAMDAAFALLAENPGMTGHSGAELTALIDSGDILSSEVFEAETRAHESEPPALPSESTESSESKKSRTIAPLLALTSIVAVAATVVWLVQNASQDDSPNVDTAMKVAEVTRSEVMIAAPIDAGTAVLADAQTDRSALMDFGQDTAGDSGLAAPLPALMISVGKYHTCVVTQGQVRCWGANFDGELGIGNRTSFGDKKAASDAPFVKLGFEAQSVAAVGDRNASFTCVVSTEGALKCFGANTFGQLGLGHTESVTEIPENQPPISLGGTVKQVAAAASQYASHACALLDDSTVRCWGNNRYGQLGLGHTTTVGDDELPSTVPSVVLSSGAKRIYAGKYHNCAILDDDSVTCWGWNDKGQLGLGNRVSIGDDELPTTAGIIPDFKAKALALGKLHSCALLDDGNVKCWGWNGKGQLGYGSKDDLGDNEPVVSIPNVELGGIAVGLSAGDNHTCALLDTGKVRCWGENNFGQLGYSHTRDIGDDETPATAGDVYIGEPALALFSGSYHNCVLLSDERIRCWGLNKFGQLGYGNTNDIGDNETPAGAGDVPYLKDHKK